MSYQYEIEKQKLFTDEGQRHFLKVRDNVKELLATAGAFRVDKVLSGNSWFCLACVDRMVELGELEELTGKQVAGQDRVFVKGRG
jgi:hypothetical protein